MMKHFEWNRQWLAAHPLKSAGVLLFLIGRLLFVAIFLYGFWHKLVKGWLWTDLMQHHFTQRLSELTPGTFQAIYLESFAIPLAMPIAWIVTWGELLIGICILLGVATRANAAFALFMFLNFAAGGYYNLTLPPLMLFALLLMLFPSGHWLGLDGRLQAKYPNSIWFR